MPLEAFLSQTSHTLFYAEPEKPLRLIKIQPRNHSNKTSKFLAVSPTPPLLLTVACSENQQVSAHLDKAIFKVERKQYALFRLCLPLLISVAEIPAEEMQRLN